MKLRVGAYELPGQIAYTIAGQFAHRFDEALDNGNLTCGRFRSGCFRNKILDHMAGRKHFQ